jgi:hypothetical protein
MPYSLRVLHPGTSQAFLEAMERPHQQVVVGLLVQVLLNPPRHGCAQLDIVAPSAKPGELEVLCHLILSFELAKRDVEPVSGSNTSKHRVAR